MINVAILAVNNCMESCVSGVRDILTVASEQWKNMQKGSSKELFSIKIITFEDQPVVTFTGAEIWPTYERDECEEIDILFIPVIYGDLTLLLSQNNLIDWLTSLNREGTVICAVCAGAFLAAQTGILDGRAATTHWSLASEFKALFPKVLIRQERMIVDEGDCITAGGVTAYMDLALYLSGRFGSPELISSLSKMLLIDPARRLQTPYRGFDSHTKHDDKEILSAQQWLMKHSNKSTTLSYLSKVAGLEPRTLSRRFKKVTGSTPMEYLRKLRIGKARMLLETTGKSFDEITFEVGYEDVSSFRRVFKKVTGLSPSVYRKRFGVLWT